MKVTQTFRCIRAFCGKSVQFDGDVCVDCKRKHAKKLDAQSRSGRRMLRLDDDYGLLSRAERGALIVSVVASVLIGIGLDLLLKWMSK